MAAISMHQGFTRFFYIFAAMSFWAGCTLDDPGSSGTQFPLSLEAEQNFSLIKLHWIPVKATGFREYILLQSTDEIPSSPTPVTSSQVTILKRIDDVDITSWNTLDILFSPRICYKLYVSIEDRFIQSSNVCLDQNFHTLPGFYDRAGHEAGLDDIVMFDRVNRQLTLYNFNEGTITKSQFENSLSFPVLQMSTHEGVTDIFAFDQSPPRILKYGYPGLSFSRIKDFSSFLYASKPYKQFVFTSNEENGGTFRTLARSNLVELDNETGLTGNKVLAVFDGDPLTVLEIGDNGVRKYGIDQSGIITLLEVKNQGVSQPSIVTASAQGRDHFITGRFGTIVDRNGNVAGALVSSINSFVLLARFYDNDQKAAYLVSENGTMKLDMVDLSNMNDITKISSFEVPSANYSDMIIDDGAIHITGVSFVTGQSIAFFLKYPIL